ncbi:hypothetical protein [Sutterella sp.]|uniref:hypothetical protein n=1 Tax=Sutterella sp. TaxID=1981025 RepID=UPI0026DEB894|nr:hypothetical protein [Sutterella sp.]MDO5531902.1 hypothetical protein [Sutterella sp.]
MTNQQETPPAARPVRHMTKSLNPTVQNYDHAFEAMRQDCVGPAVDDVMEWLALSMRCWSGQAGDVTVDAVLHMLVARCLAAGAVPYEDVIRASRRMSRPEAAAVLAEALSCARRERSGMTGMLRRHRGDWAAERAVKDVDRPVAAEVLGNRRPLPFDGVHDGHVIPRRTAWALGIVRWARSLSPDTGGSITAALRDLGSRQGYTGEELELVGAVWRERRPLLLVNGLNPYTVKLVHDLWLEDPQIAVVNVGTTMKGNPFAALRIPYIEDWNGFIPSLLATDWYPALIEPRLGGFTVTASTGLISPAALGRKRVSALKAMPMWIRTMAEIGLVSRIDALIVTFNGFGKLPPGLRLSFHRAYRLLLGIPARPLPEATGDEREALEAARRNLIKSRRELLQRIRDDSVAGFESIADRRFAGQKGARERKPVRLPTLAERAELSAPVTPKKPKAPAKAADKVTDKADMKSDRVAGIEGNAMLAAFMTDGGESR